jgi:tetratricopeptide (TPR) repeat protein
MNEPEQFLSTEAGPRVSQVPFFKEPGFHLALIFLALMLGTLAVFWPVTGHGFITFDDPNYITANSHVQSGLNRANVVWAFENFEAGFWHPLTWLSIMLDCQLYGLHAGGHHLTSLVLHAVNAALLFLILQRMTGAIWRSAFVGALFALHPLHVESVAWAADRKDVLSTFFALVTLWAYARYTGGGEGTAAGSSIEHSGSSWKKGLWYCMALVSFACAVMSKTMVVTLPLLLLLLDYWPLHRFDLKAECWKLKTLRPLLLDKLPFLAMSLAAGLLTMHAEGSVGALQDTTQFPMQLRAANATHSYWRYLGQMIWPRDLAVFYPYPASFPAWSVAAGALLLLVVSLLVLWAARAKPYLLAGWFWYLAALLPVSGLIQVGAHAHADRYTYLPLIGIFVLLAWGACDLAVKLKLSPTALPVAGIVIIVLCTGLAWRQLAYWQDSETLFRHAIRVTRNNFIAYNNLGVDLATRGKFDEAANQFRESIRCEPNYANPHGNLGQVLALQGKLSEAVTEFQTALRLKPEGALKPEDARIHSNLGDVLGTQGKITEAIQQYREALRLNPNLPNIHQTLGMALSHQGKIEEAMEQYSEALRVDPDDALMHERLGIELAKKGKFDEAVTHFREALRINPKSASMHNNLGKALEAQNKLDAAIKEYQESLRLQPSDTVTHNNLGVAVARSGRLEEAIKHFQDAIRIDSNFASAHRNLGKALATMHKSDEAIEEYRKSLQLEPGDIAVRKSLDTLLAEKELKKPAAPAKSQLQ